MAKQEEFKTGSCSWRLTPLERKYRRWDKTRGTFLRGVAMCEIPGCKEKAITNDPLFLCEAHAPALGEEEEFLRLGSCGLRR